MTERGTRWGDATRGLAAADNGAAAVEFAILAPVLLALLAGLADYGLAMFDKMELTSAARAGAHYSLIDDPDTAAIATAVVNSTNLDIESGDVTTTQFCEDSDGATATCGDADATRTFITVSVSKDFTLMVLGTTLTLTGSATVRTE